MKRSNVTKAFYQFDTPELIKRTAFHESGHAAGIYLYNNQKDLPPIFFQIRIHKPHSFRETAASAKVEGGRLIHTLPITTREYNDLLDSNDAENSTFLPDCQAAFEADIVNLLIGPLAEAKYVSMCDNEPLNPHLINFNSLKNYGGTSDLALANEYLDCFITQSSRREEKMNELFRIAFDFVHEEKNWKTITALANYILKDHKTVIGYDEAICVIDGCRAALR